MELHPEPLRPDVADEDQLEPNQLVLRRCDQRPLRVLARDPASGLYLLEDGCYVARREVEDPLRDGRRRDLRRSAQATLRRKHAEAGDFSALFPNLIPAAPRVEEIETGPLMVPGAGKALLLLVLAGWGVLVLQLCYWGT